MTRSGSLTNEVTAEIVKGGFGVTTPDRRGRRPGPRNPFRGTPPAGPKPTRDTHAVVIIGELGGTMEEEVAEAMEAEAFGQEAARGLHGRTHGTLKASAWATQAPSSPAGAAP